MNCPRCGSANIQFGTNTHSGGFSAGKGCCGYFLLGPLGLLCGACGSKTKTDEFWVCQKCGNRFTAKEAQLVQQRMLNSKTAKPVEKSTLPSSDNNDTSTPQSTEPFSNHNENALYTVVLNYAGDKKLQCIKEIREITGFGLAETSQLVERAPNTIKICDTRDEAEHIVNRLLSIGAIAEILEDSENIEQNENSNE